MRIRKITLAVLAVLLCSTSAAFGYVYGNSNLGYGGYPEFTSNHYRPTSPYSRDTYSMQTYRSEVESYVDDAKQYVEAANNDISRIAEAKQNAIREANDAVDQYNRFMRTGY